MDQQVLPAHCECSQGEIDLALAWRRKKSHCSSTGKRPHEASSEQDGVNREGTLQRGGQMEEEVAAKDAT